MNLELNLYKMRFEEFLDQQVSDARNKLYQSAIGENNTSKKLSTEPSMAKLKIVVMVK